MKPLLDSIEKRFSPVEFSNEIPGKEDLETLFDAARRAPSSFNEQPWRFIYSTRNDETSWKRMLNLLVPDNQKWAMTAPVLMLSVAKKTSLVTGKPNIYYFHDTGMAMGNLLNQATSMGLYVHQMGGYRRKKAREQLNIPDEYEPVAMMAIGYLKNEDDGKPFDRNAIEDFTFQGKWH